MDTSLKPIQKLIKDGKRKEAIQHLKVIINENPSADAWYMMALALNDDVNKIKALKRAIKIDALHTPSNVLLAKLEKFDVPGSNPNPKPDSATVTPEHEQIRQQRFQKQQDKKQTRRRRRGFGCLFSLLTGVIFSIVILSIAGLLPGVIGTVLRVTSGVEPVTQVNDIPIADTVDSLYQIEPIFSRVLGGQDFAFVDHGYLNEYRFEMVQGDSQVIFIQFLSMVATNVQNNVAILDPDGNNGMENCIFQPIVPDYDNGAAWVCYMSMSGEWSLRVLGVEGETVGGYVIGKRAVEAGDIR